MIAASLPLNIIRKGEPDPMLRSDEADRAESHQTAPHARSKIVHRQPCQARI